MSVAKELKNKIEVKLQLAAKYDRLAAVAGSIPKRNTWLFHSKRFRAQAGVLQNALSQYEASREDA